MIPLSREISLQWPCEENHLQLLSRTEAAGKRSVYVVPFPLPLFIFPLIYLCVCLCYVARPSLRHSLCCCFYQFCCLLPPLPPTFFFFFTTWKSLTAVTQIPGHSQTTYMRFTRSTSSSLYHSTGSLVGCRTHGCTLNQCRIVTKPAPTCRILCPDLPLLPLLPLVECRIPAGKQTFKGNIQSTF